jgi:hypothetical protein
MSFAERFEDLRIWQEAREQVSAIYRSMMRGSAGHSDFGFRDQLQRSGMNSGLRNIGFGLNSAPLPLKSRR